MFLYWLVFLVVKMEPTGPCHRAVVHHGNHIGGNRPERFPAHQPHHHTHHEGLADNSRCTLASKKEKKARRGAVCCHKNWHIANVSVLKLLKMATGMRALLDTVMQALPQVRCSPDAEKGKMPFVTEGLLSKTNEMQTACLLGSFPSLGLFLLTGYCCNCTGNYCTKMRTVS